MEPTPDSDRPDEKPPSRDHADLDPEEREFWDLEEDEEGGEAPSDGEEEDEEELEEDEEAESGEEDDSGESSDEALSPDEPSSRGRLKFSRGEFIWIGILGLALLAGVIYALSLFNSKVPTRKSQSGIDFPVKGSKVELRKIDTYWRKPDRAKDTGVRMSARLIPGAVVRLGSGGGNGALRFFFENEDGDFIGDPVTLTFSGGKFENTSKAESEIFATDGFEHEGQHTAYVTEQIKFWHLIVMEGPRARAPGNEFKEILRMPVSAKRN